MSYGGRRADFVYVDEARDMSSHLFDAMSYSLQSQRNDPTTFNVPLFSSRPDLHPLEVTCSACGAIAGERCNRGSDPRTGKKRYRGFHFRRKDDARLVTEAARALDPA